jgi:hypothetical protein
LVPVTSTTRRKRGAARAIAVTALTSMARFGAMFSA